MASAVSGHFCVGVVSWGLWTNRESNPGRHFFPAAYYPHAAAPASVTVRKQQLQKPLEETPKGMPTLVWALPLSGAKSPAINGARPRRRLRIHSRAAELLTRPSLWRTVFDSPDSLTDGRSRLDTVPNRSDRDPPVGQVRIGFVDSSWVGREAG